MKQEDRGIDVYMRVRGDLQLAGCGQMWLVDVASGGHKIVHRPRHAEQPQRRTG